MSRPRLGDQPRRTITLSLSPQAIAHLEELGPTRSAAAEALILPPTKSPEIVLGDTVITPPPATEKRQATADPATCPHQNERRLAWGTICADCSTRIR